MLSHFGFDPKVFYRNENIEFLIDDQDTVEFYEEKGKAKKCPSHNDRLMMALSTLDRVQQVEAIQGWFSLRFTLISARRFG